MNKKELNKIMEIIEENKKENANVMMSNNYIELMFSGYIQKELLKSELNKYDRKLYKLHENGDLHIHDAGMWLRPNCLQHPLYKLFEHGLDALNVKSKPAKHLDTALSHCLNAFALGQAHFAGGQSAPMFNVFIAPFCKGLSDKEIEQCVQQFIFQCNQISPSRGLQTIFLSLNFELEVPEFMKDVPVKYKDGTFGDYEEEMKRFTKIFLEVLNKGDASNKPFMFPNCIFYIRNEKPDEEILELVVKNMVENSNTYLLNGLKYGHTLSTAMGCVDGQEVVIYKYHDRIYVETFEKMWKRFEYYEIKKHNVSEYIEVDKLQIYDSRKGFVNVKRIIRNPDMNNWVEIILKTGRRLIATEDHPLPTKSGEIKRIDELTKNDEIPIIYEYDLPEEIDVSLEYAYALGSLTYEDYSEKLIPNEVFMWKRQSKLFFIAGMIGSNRIFKRIKINTKSKELALQQMILLQSVGIPVKIKFDGEYIIENLTIKEINEYSKIKEIRRLGKRNEYSYDVETESEYFDVSGIYSHNCRTYLDDSISNNPYLDVLGTGNLSYITLNLPRLALRKITENIDIDKELDKLIRSAVKILLIKRKTIWQNWMDGYYPFVSNKLYKDDNGYYYNIGYTTMSIGIIGINDMKKILGDEFNEYEFVEKIKKKIDELNKYTYFDLAQKLGIKDYVKDEKQIEVPRWSLIGSPAEGCSEKFKKIDNKKYEKILKECDLYDKKYYTNSIMVPEETDITGHEKIMIEQKYHPLLNGGIICHVFNAIEPKKDYIGLLRYMISILKNTDVRYITISNVIVHCKDCDTSYIGKKDDKKCKKCGSENIELFQKISGYLAPVDRYNEGKFDEFNRRNEFKL